MTSIPLALVVAFLRPRGAFHVLEGAPYTSADVCGLAGLTVDAIEWELEYQPDAALYLGSGDVCPAAEGWAARVLAMALNTSATHLTFGPRERVALCNGSRLECQWWWPDDEAVAIFREARMIGEAPSTPAERLAAVLRYELGRAR